MQTVEAQTSGGIDALLRPQTAKALEGRLEYGFGVLEDRWTGTPKLGLGLTGTSRETTLGWRLAEEKLTGLAFGLDVEARR